MKRILLLTALLFSVLTFAQGQNGSISGQILDKEMNNDPLPFANVQIAGTTKGTTTDFDGLFELTNIEPGTYTLVVSFVGYETLQLPDVVVEAGKVTEVNTALGAGSVSLDEVVVSVSAQRDSEVALLLEQKKAKEIKVSIGAEELTRKGIGNAAQAVSQISGISKQEGSSNVFVRGLGDRYLNTTFNGLTLPSNDIDKKNIDLNLFSTDIISNIGVSKAYSSRFYGDFSAGNIDVTSMEHRGSGKITSSVSMGVNTRAAGQDFRKNSGTGVFGFYGRYDHNPYAVVLSHGVDPIASEGLDPMNVGLSLTAGNAFNFSNGSRLSYFFSGSLDSSYEFREGSAVDFTTTEKVAFPNIEEYDYSVTTTLMGNLTYAINEDHKIMYNSLFINNASDQVGYYGVKGQGRNRDAFLNTDEGFYQMNVQFNQDLIFVNQLLGQHSFDDEKLELTWGVGYNNVFAHEPDRKRISLENYQFALDGDPDTNPSFFTNTSFDNQRYFENIEDEELNSRVNLAYNLNEGVKLNFGYNGRLKNRDFDNIRYGYRNIDPTLPVDPDNFDQVFNLENIVNGRIETDVIRPIAPEYGIGPINFPGRPENVYSGSLAVHAGYASGEISIGDKWLIVPGIRAESVNQEISWDVINLSVNNPSASVVSESIYLPSLNLRYAMGENSNLRFSYSNTVSFPEFKELAPFIYEGVTQRVGGNPDLLGRTSNDINYVNVIDKSYSEILNLDLKYEWFISKGELLSLAVFTKTINDPVNRVVANDATGTQRYFRTGEKAQVYGFEFELRKNLLLDEQERSILGFGVNGSYMDTTQDLYPTIAGTYNTSFNRETDDLQGASPFIINADLSFNPFRKDSFNGSLNIIGSYFSDRIYALGSGQLGNMMEIGYPTLDLVWKSSLGEHVEINFSAANMLDPEISVVRELEPGGGKDVTIYDYKRGMNLGLQLKYKF